VKGDRLFYLADGGIATCANAATGETIWQERVPGGTFFGSPVIAGDKLFALSKRGNLIALSASDQFELLANNQLGDKSDATPAISDGRMYVRTYGHLFSVGGKN
jgi:outer membrane protein assembly factor BamB